jgi:hypothetical protein
MIPYKQIIALLCGTALQIAILINFREKTHFTISSFYTSDPPPEELIVILMAVSLILIIYGLIPWHIFRRAKIQ